MPENLPTQHGLKRLRTPVGDGIIGACKFPFFGDPP